MGVPYAHGTDVTIVRRVPVGTDRYGNEVYGDPTTFVLPGCGAAPGDAAELHVGSREGVEVRWTIYAPDADADVRAHDEAILYGQTYRVDGGARPWRNPMTGWAPGCVFQLVDVQG